MKFPGKKNKDVKQDIQQMRQAPVIDLIIRYDGRTNQVAMIAIGGSIDPPGVYHLLEMARGVIRTMELEAIKAKGNGAGPKVEEAGQDKKPD